MKNVGILTFQWFDNYGTLFQAFALQEAIRKLGHSVHIVPLTIPRATGLRRILAPSIPRTLAKIRKLVASIADGSAKFHRDCEEFRRCRYLRGGMESLDFYKATKYNFKEDVLVFGSDNIWSVGDLPLDSECFSVWFGKGIKHPNKVVYGASTGGYLHSHRFCKDVIKMISAGGFKRISMREPINVETLRKAGLEDVQFVPDPTLLLDREFWDHEAAAGNKVELEPSYILGYDLNYHHTDVPVSSVCEEISATSGMPIRCIHPREIMKNRKCALRPSPAEWLWVIKNANLLVTNSFHGVVFSIVFNTPVIFVPIKGEHEAYNMRAIEFLKLFGLENRILNNVNMLPDMVHDSIAWEKIECIKTELMNRGLTYLQRIL